MFPFNYIPESIDPKIRKLIVLLISIQFIAFLLLIIILTYEHFIKKNIKIEEKKMIIKIKKKKMKKKTQTVRKK